MKKPHAVVPGGKDAIYFIPKGITGTIASHPLLKPLMVTGAGFLKRLKQHQVEPDDKAVHSVIYCIGGQGKLTLKKRAWKFRKGDMLFLHKNERYQYRSDRDNPWTIYWANLTGDTCEDYFRSLDIRREKPLLHVQETPKVNGFFVEILNMLSRGYSLRNIIYVSTCLQNLLAYTSLLYMYRFSDVPERFNMDRIIDIMIKHLDRHLDVDMLAGQCRLSKYHFSRKFKEKTGHAPMDYFIRLKIQRASEEILTTDKKIVHIAQSLGYEDPYYFSRIFKKIVGTSPARFRTERQAAERGRL
jgi:AraC-like DNA-binding protein